MSMVKHQWQMRYTDRLRHFQEPLKFDWALQYSTIYLIEHAYLLVHLGANRLQLYVFNKVIFGLDNGF